MFCWGCRESQPKGLDLHVEADQLRLRGEGKDVHEDKDRLHREVAYGRGGRPATPAWRPFLVFSFRDRLDTSRLDAYPPSRLTNSPGQPGLFRSGRKEKADFGQPTGEPGAAG